ncbi:unnamed protein product [Adineta ricciae]|uniref:Methyltransferase domain-containing protein n=1 Tax=Adineta ricciae TaxID=249248 RepID=A0A814BKK5_ADIRI|nr:unnamed protein product [Adineta ricciae]CAF1520555.1 unnamed protein product [Adineta ricciae]
MSNHSPAITDKMIEKPVYMQRTRMKLESAKNVREKFSTKICGQDFVIYPNVFNPDIFFATEFLAKEVIEVVKAFHNKAPKVLEIGTGAGYTTILAILNGASHVTCTDINKDALQNVKENANKHNVANQTTIKYSDVFNALHSDDRYDIIFWNYPFGHINKSVQELEMLERAVFDPFYESLNVYLKNANDYLKPNGGRLFLGFSTTAGCKETFEDIAKTHKWNIHLRNETISDTVPIMQMGFYELTKFE